MKNLRFVAAIALTGVMVGGSPLEAALITTNDLSFNDQLWVLDKMKVREAWSQTTGANEVSRSESGPRSYYFDPYKSGCFWVSMRCV